RARGRPGRDDERRESGDGQPEPAVNAHLGTYEPVGAPARKHVRAAPARLRDAGLKPSSHRRTPSFTSPPLSSTCASTLPHKELEMRVSKVVLGIAGVGLLAVGAVAFAGRAPRYEFVDFGTSMTPTTPTYRAALSPASRATVKEFRIPILDATVEVAPGVTYNGWTFGGTVPGPVVGVQSEFYLGAGNSAQPGQPDWNQALAKQATYVVFNGRAFQYQAHPLEVAVGDHVRFFVVNAGPSFSSDFHIVGTVFDRVYPDGNPDHALTGVQTWSVPAGGGAVFETVFEEEGSGAGAYA